MKHPYVDPALSKEDLGEHEQLLVRESIRLLSRGLPWRSNLHSRYQRSRQGNGWVQRGQHGKALTWAQLDDQLGLVEFGLQRSNGAVLEARLEGVGLQEDQGIPGWRLSLAG